MNLKTASEKFSRKQKSGKSRERSWDLSCGGNILVSTSKLYVDQVGKSMCSGN